MLPARFEKRLFPFAADCNRELELVLELRCFLLRLRELLLEVFCLSFGICDTCFLILLLLSLLTLPLCMEFHGRLHDSKLFATRQAVSALFFLLCQSYS